MKYYYAKDNVYASAYAHGFQNTWYVCVFSSKAARDAYVQNTDSVDCEAIKRSEVISTLSYWDPNKNRVHGPVPFSGQYWGIEPTWAGDDQDPGVIGQIVVAGPNDYGVERFYK